MKDEAMKAGHLLVYRILVKRRIKCNRAGTHAIGWCKSCGVHQ